MALAQCWSFLFAVRAVNEKAIGQRHIYTPAHSVTPPDLAPLVFGAPSSAHARVGIGRSISE